MKNAQSFIASLRNFRFFFISTFEFFLKNNDFVFVFLVKFLTNLQTFYIRIENAYFFSYKRNKHNILYFSLKNFHFQCLQCLQFYCRLCKTIVHLKLLCFGYKIIYFLKFFVEEK